jgi:hypothetical protein
MRRLLLILFCLTSLSGCELVSSLLGILGKENCAVDHALSSPSESIRAEGAAAQRDGF